MTIFLDDRSAFPPKFKIWGVCLSKSLVAIFFYSHVGTVDLLHNQKLCSAPPNKDTMASFFTSDILRWMNLLHHLAPALLCFSGGGQ